MPSLVGLQERLGNRLRILAIAEDKTGDDAVAPFLAKQEAMKLEIFLDAPNEAGIAFGAHILPTSFLIDRSGRVVASMTGVLDWDSPRVVAEIERYLAGDEGRLARDAPARRRPVFSNWPDWADDRAFALMPADADALYNRGLDYGRSGNDGCALEYFDKALRLKPGHVYALSARGTAYAHMGDYNRAIELKPDDAETFADRCWERALGGAVAEAQADCDEALGLAPGFRTALATRGFVHLKGGKAGAAIADYDAALAGDSKVASSLYGRGLAQRLQGNAAEGDADIAAAKEIDPDIGRKFEAWGLRSSLRRPSG